MLLYRTPNLVIDKHEWHATVRIDHGRIRKRFYFRPLSIHPKMWQPIDKWKGHKPTSREFSNAFQPFKRHMLRAERSVVENGRAARELAA